MSQRWLIEIRLGIPGCPGAQVLKRFCVKAKTTEQAEALTAASLVPLGIISLETEPCTPAMWGLLKSAGVPRLTAT
jgi:hypothetical protein